MKKRDLATLAMLGLTSGLMVSCQNQNNAAPSNMQQDQMNPDEQSFYRQLNSWGKKNFEKMGTEHRKHVMDTAEHGCRGRNECKGMGGCRTEKNVCAGQNECKGQGGCQVSANKAVELIKNRMETKRSNM